MYRLCFKSPIALALAFLCASAALLAMIYGAGIADSNAHSPFDIPLLLAGGGAGNLKGGRHIRFKGMPLANLHLTLLDQFGVQCDRIGDSTGKVDPRLLSLS